ncbi:hypothetical protein [Nostoc sp.]|uniref:hypothetical protein n=1 Tax=Nostoc sp. TaxID=1180 RepID=UPI002FF5B4A9
MPHRSRDGRSFLSTRRCANATAWLLSVTARRKYRQFLNQANGVVSVHIKKSL